MSWFTFKDLFLRCHLRPICAPALSVAGFARDQLSHAITAARLRRLTRSLLSRLLEKRRTRFACQAVPSLTRPRSVGTRLCVLGHRRQDPLTETFSFHDPKQASWSLQCGMEAAASGAGQDGARMVGCADDQDYLRSRRARRLATEARVHAAGWEPSPFQQFGGRFKGDRGWQFVSFTCGHDVMMDQPQELAAALIAAA